MTQPDHTPQQYPHYPPYATPEPKGLSIASLVMGIASLFFGWTFLVPIAGVVVGFMARSREPAGRGMALAGIILNGLCIVGWIIAVALLLGLGLLGFLTVAANQ